MKTCVRLCSSYTKMSSPKKLFCTVIALPLLLAIALIAVPLYPFLAVFGLGKDKDDVS